ncbi:MAG: type II toxin-antitoxin system HigB family toxin [Bacteroidetes bacterium]|nr:MAG: type II toxin-antitoxin system HigB family toxin [Bacteroidota bacterium]
MRVVTPKRLMEYSRKHPDAKIPLLYWFEKVKNADWNSLNEIKNDFRSVDYVGNKHYIFDIKGNDYRIVVIIIFISKKVYIRFIGTHAEYDKINANDI